jgi:hypothetical protein
MAVVPYPPYSLHLTPCDFFFFPRMKSKIKGRRFQDITEIQKQSLTVLQAIPKSQFQWCFQQCQKRWTRCTNSEGNNLKGTETSNTKGKHIFVIDSVRKLLDTHLYMVKRTSYEVFIMQSCPASRHLFYVRCKYSTQHPVT